MSEVLWLVGLAVVSTAFIWFGGTRFEAAADRLSTYYGLPAAVQGAVVVAIGSSMPELLTALLAPLRHGEFELGVAVILGSAVFNVLVIPALATLATDGGMRSTPGLVYKEAQFYMLAVAVFLLTLSFAVIYNPVDGGGGELTRGLVLIPLVTYLLYVFIQYEETIEHDVVAEVEDVAVLREWGVLAVAFVFIAVGVEGFIHFAVDLGGLMGTDSYVWGLTVIAAASSLPDAVLSVTAARRDNEVTSIANVFGSNVFDLLVVVPAAVIVVGSTAVDYTRATPLIGYLIFATVLLFTLMRTGFRVSRAEAYVLAAAYLGFAVWTVAEAFGYVGLLSP